MRTTIALAVLLAACGTSKRPDGNGDTDGGNNGDASVCTTNVTGTVYAPNGTLPLYGVNVYIPTSDVGDIPDGLMCTKCTDVLPGNPSILVQTDENGQFTLANVTPGNNVPVVIQIGKWRRVITIPQVTACQTQALAQPDTTLPKAHDDLTANTQRVDMPHIALSTGGADSMECLLLRLGISPSEIGTAGDPAYVHMYSDLESAGVGVSQFTSAIDSGKAFADSATLWGNATTPGNLGSYDIVVLSCEGDQVAKSKPQEAMDHLKAYADGGGRVFASHWQNVWLEGSTHDTSNGTQKPAVWPSIATFDDLGEDPSDPATDTIDEQHNPKGMSFSTWMMGPQVMGSTTRDEIIVHSGRATAKSVDNTKAERWVHLISSTQIQPQMVQFETPNEMPEAQRCGKVVFTDMHVSGDAGFGSYPDSCGGVTDLSAQEKALAFMFFDLSSCVGPIF